MQLIIPNRFHAEAYVTFKQKLAKEADYIPFEQETPEEALEKAKVTFDKKNDPFRHIVLAEAGDRIVGYTDVTRPPMEEISHRAFLELGVLQAHGGKGIGTTLMDKAESWAKEVGCKTVGFYVVVPNVTATIMYLKRGYRFEGLRHGAYYKNGNYHDEYIMAKTL